MQSHERGASARQPPVPFSTHRVDTHPARCLRRPSFYRAYGQGVCRAAGGWALVPSIPSRAREKPP